MNCRGIIEKYRKTNELFRVCLFAVKSTPGKGSCFYFRLPVGVRKVLTILALLFAGISGLTSCNDSVQSEPMDSMIPDSLELIARHEYELLLDSASVMPMRPITATLTANMRGHCNISIRP